MKLLGNTILITGGTSGIGMGLTKALAARGNTVVVTGRDTRKLQSVTQETPEVHTVQSDASSPDAIAALFEEIAERFPQLNMLINNAGVMRKLDLQDQRNDAVTIGQEIEVNLLSPVRMVQQFLPLLKRQSVAAIVNVTSGLAFTPFPISPVYSAAKSGLHAYSRSLRMQLSNTRIRVFELAPPAVDTPLQDAFTPDDVKGAPMMTVDKLVAAALRGLEKDQMEIVPGASRMLRTASRIAPGLLLKAMRRSVKAMHAAAARDHALRSSQS